MYLIPTQTLRALSQIASHKEAKQKAIYLDTETLDLVALLGGQVCAYANLQDCQESMNEFPLTPVPEEVPYNHKAIPIPVKPLTKLLKLQTADQSLPITRYALLTTNGNAIQLYVIIEHIETASINVRPTKFDFTLPDYHLVMDKFDTLEETKPCLAQTHYLDVALKVMKEAAAGAEYPHVSMKSDGNLLFMESNKIETHQPYNPQVKLVVAGMVI